MVARPWVANSQAMMAKIASGATATIQPVTRNMVAITASSSMTTGRAAASPMRARPRPNRTANTSVGSTRCAAMAATTLVGIRSST